jgi:hypothetical protein
MLNRSAVVIRYKQPFINWINSVEPEPRNDVTLAEANDDSTVYLVQANEERDIQRWLEHKHSAIFEELLNEWYVDPSLWPAKRTLKMLKEWCSFEFHPVVHDTGGEPLEDEGFEL